MRNRRLPSPAMIVAIIALIAALSSPAIARLIVTSSSQIATGAVTGSDIRNGTVTGNDIKNNTIESGDLNSKTRKALAEQAAKEGGAGGFEAARTDGPFGVGVDQQTTVATLSGIDPGQYAIFAKTQIQYSKVGPDSLSRCILIVADAGGERQDESVVRVNGLASSGPIAHNMQLTATFPGAGTARLDCAGNQGTWSASDTSIIAIKLSDLKLFNVDG